MLMAIWKLLGVGNKLTNVYKRQNITSLRLHGTAVVIWLSVFMIYFIQFMGKSHDFYLTFYNGNAITPWLCP